MFEDIFNTIMDVKGKTNDNMKDIMDKLLFFHRKNIEFMMGHTS
jgi:uncharacterized protein YggU (UPF0235/DUF167 family)